MLSCSFLSFHCLVASACVRMPPGVHKEQGMEFRISHPVRETSSLASQEGSILSPAHELVTVSRCFVTIGAQCVADKVTRHLFTSHAHCSTDAARLLPNCEVGSPRCDAVVSARGYACSRPELAEISVEIWVEFGEAAKTILAAVEPLGADLIVLCSHGYTGFKRWALGSVAQQLIPQSSVPVLILRDGGPTLAPKPVSALVALDGSPLSEEVLAPLTQLVTALAPMEEKTLHLTHVVELPPTYGRIGMHASANQRREEAKRLSQAYL